MLPDAKLVALVQACHFLPSPESHLQKETTASQRMAAAELAAILELLQTRGHMSRAAKKATIGYAEFDADSPTLYLQEGTAEMVPPRSLEMLAELFDKLSGSRWFCKVGEA